MLAKETLFELKLKMPSKYVPAIILAYRKRYGIDVSRWTVMRFFKGNSYSERLHNAIIDVASMQQELKNKTEELINE